MRTAQIIESGLRFQTRAAPQLLTGEYNLKALHGFDCTLDEVFEELTGLSQFEVSTVEGVDRVILEVAHSVRLLEEIGDLHDAEIDCYRMLKAAEQRGERLVLVSY